MEIETVKYRINWAKFKPGCSFFIPCLNTKSAKRHIREHTNRYKYKIVMKAIVVEGIKGLRVWRV